MRPERDPSLSSWYVDETYYGTLVKDFSDFSNWQRDELTVADPALRDRCRALLEREARLLDQGQLDEWLALYAPECLYWVPGTPGGGDPRREVAIVFDDRRQLESRIFRLRTGYAWSQVPQSRTVHVVSNVEVFRTAEASVWMIRSTFLVSEFRAQESRILSGWCAHRVSEHAGGWEIRVKQVNLIDFDQSLRNLSILL
jgi:3-phenylpropionate/cinnamic acid dioxygenase small subunit